MKKMKEKHAAAEKLRMEKWEDRKTKEIRVSERVLGRKCSSHRFERRHDCSGGLKQL